MDFAALMSSAMSKGQTDPGPRSDSGSAKNKYVKRADLEKAREEAYAAEQRALQEEREAKAAKKRKLEEDEAESNRLREEKRRRLAEESRRKHEEDEESKERARRKRLGLPELPSKDCEKEQTPLAEGEEDIADDELRELLRAKGEPVRLFGESHRQRLRRYRRLSSKVAPMKGFTTLELVPEEKMKINGVPKDKEGKEYLFRQLASYFSMVLNEWEYALQHRPENVKQTFQGKAAHNAMIQSRENMRPLFRKFEKGELAILDAVVEIVQAAQEKRYVDANDGYLRLSIGKAAWPIGVTMVGIHERSAREKLHESEAHIMSDEVTRKFLQSIKRCLSFAQTRWPPTDPLQLMG
ncbi:MAG: mRNA splicing protein prp18 [Sclerophora amabilis]|nr:MAG: mRNA splicing protein prp18 [Sclerophora amabilis]